LENEIQVFSNEEFGKIRTITIDGDPWFVGVDVANKLGYQNGSRDINRHVDERDRLKTMIFDGTQMRETIIINESGLYSLVLSSKLPSAREFQHWVTSEVLPTLRKTGSYSITRSDMTEIRNVANVVNNAVGVVNDLSEKIDVMNANINARIDRAEKEIAEAKRMAEEARNLAMDSKIRYARPITYEDCQQTKNAGKTPSRYVSDKRVSEIVKEIATLTGTSENSVFSMIYTMMREKKCIDVQEYYNMYKETHPDKTEVSAWYVVKSKPSLFNAFVTTAEEILDILRMTSFDNFSNTVRLIPYLAYSRFHISEPILWKKIYREMELNGIDWDNYGGKSNRAQALKTRRDLQDAYCDAVRSLFAEA